jgi:PDDEXK-like uncharacterized protein DUF3799
VLNNLKIIRPNEKVSRPGAYSIKIEDYHGDICTGPSVSSSGLRTIFSKSPAHYFVTSPLNICRDIAAESAAFSFGRAAHHLLLGEADFDKYFSVRPVKWETWRTADAKDWREAQVALGKTVVIPSELASIKQIAGELSRSPVVRAGLLNGVIEASLIWQDQETGIWLKARPDAIPVASGDAADLKTTTSVDHNSLSRTIADFGYHMQGALICEAFRNVLGVEMTSFTLVFVEKSAPFSVRIVTLKDDDLALGARQLRAAIRIFANCVQTRDWLGPGGVQTDATYIEIPPWSRKSIEDRLEYIEMEYGL